MEGRTRKKISRLRFIYGVVHLACTQTRGTGAPGMSLKSTHVTHADRTTFPDIQLIRPRDYAPGGPGEAQSSELRDGPVPKRVGGDREKDRQAYILYMTETHTDRKRENERTHATGWHWAWGMDNGAGVSYRRG